MQRGCFCLIGSLCVASWGVPVQSAAQGSEPVAVYRAITNTDPYMDWAELAEFPDGSVQVSMLSSRGSQGQLPVLLTGTKQGTGDRCRVIAQVGKAEVLSRCPSAGRFRAKFGATGTQVEFFEIPIGQSFAFGPVFPIGPAGIAKQCTMTDFNFKRFPKLAAAVEALDSALPPSRQAWTPDAKELLRTLNERADILDNILAKRVDVAVGLASVRKLDGKLAPIFDLNSINQAIALASSLRNGVIDRLAAAAVSDIGSGPPLNLAEAVDLSNLSAQIGICEAGIGLNDAASRQLMEAAHTSVRARPEQIRADITETFNKQNTSDDLYYYVNKFSAIPLVQTALAGMKNDPLDTARARAKDIIRKAELQAKADEAAAAAAASKPVRSPPATNGPASPPNSTAILAAIVREAEGAYKSNPRYQFARMMEGSSAVGAGSKMRENWDYENGEITLSVGDRTNGQYSFFNYDVSNVTCTSLRGAPGSYNCQFDATLYARMLLGSLTLVDRGFPTTRVRTMFRWNNGRWEAPVIREGMMNEIANGQPRSVSSNGGSDLCRSLGAGVVAAGGRSVSPGLNPQSWGC